MGAVSADDAICVGCTFCFWVVGMSSCTAANCSFSSCQPAASLAKSSDRSAGRGARVGQRLKSMRAQSSSKRWEYLLCVVSTYSARLFQSAITTARQFGNHSPPLSRYWQLSSMQAYKRVHAQTAVTIVCMQLLQYVLVCAARTILP